MSEDRTTLDPWTPLLIGSIRQAALLEFLKITGQQKDLFAACLKRAAQAMEDRGVEPSHAAALRQAVAISREEAHQLVLTQGEG